MAHIQDRGKQHERRWQARYRDPSGGERSRTFARKLDAQRWLDAMTAEMVSGSYVDPRAGRVTVRAFAERWLAAQTHEESTREAIESRLRVHVYPTFGTMELRAIRPSTVQAWLRGRQQQCAPQSVRVMLANLSAILGAAVEDGLIASNPCAARSVKPPALEDKRVVPWAREQVQFVIEAHPRRFRAVPVVAAGAGLRQGEAFGLAMEDVDFLRHVIHVRRQVKLVRGKLVFAPPKGGRVRDVPLAESVALELAEQLRAHPPGEVALPWRVLDAEPVSAALVFTTREGGPLTRRHYNVNIWKRALKETGVEPTRANGIHALRHYYASALLDGGVSIAAVADYLGHHDPAFTLRTYTHLMPSSEGRARSAVDAALGPRAESLRNDAAVER